jgi:integrase/recombinase XerD
MPYKTTPARASLRNHITTSHRTSITLKEAFQEFLNVKSIAGLRERTLKDHKDHFRYFNEFLETTGSVVNLVEEVTPSLCRAYVAYLKNEKSKWDTHENIPTENMGISDTTINIRLRTLKAQFNFYLDEGFIEYNPWSSVPLLKTDKKDLEVFSKDQFLRLLEVPNKKTFAGFRNFVIMIALLDTGLRISELLSLKDYHVDWDNSILWLGASRAKLRMGRPIPISERTFRLLKDLINENAILPEWDRTIFISVSGKPLCSSSVRQIMKEYGKKAAISNVRVSPHTLRHTFSTHFILNGGDPFSLMKILGHSSIEMTMRYIQMNTEEIKKQHGEFSPLTTYHEVQSPKRLKFARTVS